MIHLIVLRSLVRLQQEAPAVSEAALRPTNPTIGVPPRRRRWPKQQDTRPP